MDLSRALRCLGYVALTSLSMGCGEDPQPRRSAIERPPPEHVEATRRGGEVAERAAGSDTRGAAEASPTSKAAGAPEALPWVGYWESVSTSRGGIGAALQIGAEGRMLFWVCVIVDGSYEIEGDLLDLDPSGEGERENKVRFTVDRTTLTQSRDGEVVRTLTRIGEGEGIVGAWTWPHHTGQPAYQRLHADGRSEFRLRFPPVNVLSYEILDEARIATKAGARFPRAVYQVLEDVLIQEDKQSRFRRRGLEAWYPLP